MHLIDLLQQNNKSFISSKSGVNVSFNSPCLHFGQLLSFIHKSQKIFKHLSHFFEILFKIFYCILYYLIIFLNFQYKLVY